MNTSSNILSIIAIAPLMVFERLNNIKLTKVPKFRLLEFESNQAIYIIRSN